MSFNIGKNVLKIVGKRTIKHKWAIPNSNLEVEKHKSGSIIQWFSQCVKTEKKSLIFSKFLKTFIFAPKIKFTIDKNNFLNFLAGKFKWDNFGNFQTMCLQQFVNCSYADVISLREKEVWRQRFSGAARPRMGTEADLSLRGGEVILSSEAIAASLDLQRVTSQ